MNSLADRAEKSRRFFLLLMLFLVGLTTMPRTGVAAFFPWHDDINATLFWIGEQAGVENGYISNQPSAWDSDWLNHFGGVDTPFQRNGFLPAGFHPNENPFYVALPFGDFDEFGRKPGVDLVVPWAGDEPLGDDDSVLKNHWLEIRANGRSVYAQWEDVGPFDEDDADYVFAGARPANGVNDSAGIDMSPAVWDYLGLDKHTGIVPVSWRFVAAAEVPVGPWSEHVSVGQTYWWPSGLRAFPGADVAGAGTPGGRGGAVIEVTSLAVTGPGSLGAALAASGKRIIVFRVGGVIDLHGQALIVDQPYVTIAGQTAPGAGIVLKNGSLGIHTHDVVLRGLRLRNALPSVAASISIGGPAAMSHPRNIIIDHCSISNAFGDALRVDASAHDIGLSWNIIAESGQATSLLLNRLAADGAEPSTPPTARHNLFVPGADAGVVQDNLVYDPSAGRVRDSEGILTYVGALAADRDDLDARIVDTVLRGGGPVSGELASIDWSAHAGTTSAEMDTDRDGMPDTWELERGQDIYSDTDAIGDQDGDGYTNIEDYIDSRLSRELVEVDLAVPPLATEPVSPIAQAAGGSVRFVWKRVSNATQYQLWVRPLKANGGIDWRQVVHNQWYSDAQAACDAASGECGVSLTLDSGQRYTWMVLTRNAWGYGGWSSRASFGLPAAQAAKPAPTVPLAPLGDQTALRVDFSWRRIAAADRYQLWIRPLTATGGTDWSQVISNQWYDSTQAACNAVTGRCGVSLTLPGAGRYAWMVLTRNSQGFGGWSSRSTFSIVP